MSTFHLPKIDKLLLLCERKKEIRITIYLETSTHCEENHQAVIQLRKFISDIEVELKKHRTEDAPINRITHYLRALCEDTGFWLFQSRTLAILVSPHEMTTFRMTSRAPSLLTISDRFYLKPMLREITFPHCFYVLALTENEARLIECYPSAPPVVIDLEGMPRNARHVLRKLSVRARKCRFSSGTQKKTRLYHYTKAVEKALRPYLEGSDQPMVLASPEPLNAQYREVNTLDNLLVEGIVINPDVFTECELMKLARPVITRHYQSTMQKLKHLIEKRRDQQRIIECETAAHHAAGKGAISELLISIDCHALAHTGEAGELTPEQFSKDVFFYSLGVIDEIAKKVLATGGRVWLVHKHEFFMEGNIIAVTRHTL